MAPNLNREILCTVGPASLQARVLQRLEELGVSLFRINLSHTKLKDLPRVVDFLRAHSRVPVCLDTEGAQIRTGDMVPNEVVVRENTIVRAHRGPVPGDSTNFNFNPADTLDALREGDFISIDFNTVLVQVVEKAPDSVAMRVIHGGVIGRNKAVTVERDLPLAPLSPKDEAALRWGREHGIRHVALSFANRGSDVDAVRALVGADTRLISKIECRNALLNLDEIAARSDALLIDRGDLSRQEPIERIPSLQKRIIRRGLELDRPVYVATNLLESMISAPKPTRAEVNDVVNTLLDGASGLVLAAETAIGRDPVGCVAMIVRLIHEYHDHHRALREADGAYRPAQALSFLGEPHGGALVERVLPPAAQVEAEALPRVAVDRAALLDAQQIAVGTYSPLAGFMDRETLASVLATRRLPDGTAWPLPILLPVSDEVARQARAGQPLALTDAGGTVHAVLEVSEVFTYDQEALARQGFGTASPRHPGVAALRARGRHYLAGAVSLARRLPSPARQYELTPAESRFVLQHKGWQRVVGVHADSPVLGGHEHVQLAALERSGADGLLVSPALGPGRPGDFLPETVLSSYQMMVDFGHYPAGRVLIGALAAYPRHAGPREAVFAALCRKNLGCSHFIVTGDQYGPRGLHRARDYHALFDELDDLGITPLFFDSVGYDQEARRYTEGDAAQGWRAIRARQARDALVRNRPLPDWCMREVIQDMLRARLHANQPVFQDVHAA